MVVTGGQAKELDMQDGGQMDIGQELAGIKRTLRDAQRRIIFRAEVATVKNFRKLVSWQSSLESPFFPVRRLVDINGTKYSREPYGGVMMVVVVMVLMSCS